MRNECFIEGQISIFGLSTMEVVRTKGIIIKEETKEIDKFDNIIKLYSKSCSRTVKTLSGALLVELEEKTLYFNSNEIFNTEFTLEINKIEDINNEVSIDKINLDFKVNDEVNIEYQGVKSIGKVVRIYNNGETVYVKFNTICRFDEVNYKKRSLKIE